MTTQHLEHGWARSEGKEPKAWDLRRLGAVTAFGIVGMGPMGHVWYIYLDRFTKRFCKTNGSMVATKVASVDTATRHAALTNEQRCNVLRIGSPSSVSHPCARAYPLPSSFVANAPPPCSGDTFVFGPVCLWLFFASVSVMEGTPWETIRRKLWRGTSRRRICTRARPITHLARQVSMRCAGARHRGNVWPCDGRGPQAHVPAY